MFFFTLKENIPQQNAERKIFGSLRSPLRFSCLGSILITFTKKKRKNFSLAALAIILFLIWPIPWVLSGYGLVTRSCIQISFACIMPAVFCKICRDPKTSYLTVCNTRLYFVARNVSFLVALFKHV